MTVCEGLDAGQKLAQDMKGRGHILHCPPIVAQTKNRVTRRIVAEATVASNTNGPILTDAHIVNLIFW